jgi:hypothetical protein
MGIRNAAEDPSTRPAGPTKPALKTSRRLAPHQERQLRATQHGLVCVEYGAALSGSARRVQRGSSAGAQMICIAA